MGFCFPPAHYSRRGAYYEVKNKIVRLVELVNLKLSRNFFLFSFSIFVFVYAARVGGTLMEVVYIIHVIRRLVRVGTPVSLA